MHNTFWNPEDKRKSKKQIISEYIIKHIEKQKETEKYYKKYPNQRLIRDGNGNLKVVTKNYYLYHNNDDEYDTETEFDFE